MSEFKVGVKVRVIDKVKDGLYCNIGTIATVIEVDNNDTYNDTYNDGFIVKIDWEKDSCWVHESEIEKVTYTNVKQPKIKGLWTSATTSRVILLILIALLVPSLIRGGLQSISSSILAVLTFIASVNDEMCRYEFKERKRYRKDVK